MSILRTLPLIFTLLFILLQRINIRITKTDELTVKLNFNIIAIVLLNEKSRIRKIKTNFLSALRPSYKAAVYLLSKSAVKLYRPSVQSSDLHYSESYMDSVRDLSSYIFLSYIKSKSKSFKYVDRSEFIDNNLSDYNIFDVRFYFSFIHLINSALIFIYYILKNKVKKVLKNV